MTLIAECSYDRFIYTLHITLYSIYALQENIEKMATNASFSSDCKCKCKPVRIESVLLWNI